MQIVLFEHGKLSQQNLDAIHSCHSMALQAHKPSSTLLGCAENKTTLRCLDNARPFSRSYNSEFPSAYSLNENCHRHLLDIEAIKSLDFFLKTDTITSVKGEW
ncbi:hypothetical protein Tcan_00849, partial [Toxocara canis]